LCFLGNKKDKILSKNLGFYAWLGFLIGMHEVNPDLFTLVCVFLRNKKDKILSKNLGFYAWLGFLIGMHEVNPDLFTLVCVFLANKKKIIQRIWVSMLG